MASRTERINKMMCQSCREEIINIIELNDDVLYLICHNCILLLVTHSLEPSQWKNLIEFHGKEPFYLHSDFYDDDGNAIQPL